MLTFTLLENFSLCYQTIQALLSLLRPLFLLFLFVCLLSSINDQVLFILRCSTTFLIIFFYFGLLERLLSLFSVALFSFLEHPPPSPQQSHLPKDRSGHMAALLNRLSCFPKFLCLTQNFLQNLSQVTLFQPHETGYFLNHSQAKDFKGSKP